MTLNDLTDKAAIVTGGTTGIGLATGLALARRGAHVYLTHRWGSSDEDEIRRRFADAGALEPVIVCADVSSDEDTRSLMERIRQDHDRVEVFVSNVSFAHVSRDLDDLSLSALTRSLDYSAWPFVAYLQEIRRTFGTYPRYAIGMSSLGPDYFLPGYDFVAAAKTVMETFCRYLTADLLGEDIRINVLRAWFVETQSLLATFGPDFAPFCREYHGPDFFLQPDDVANAVETLCGGRMDGVKGQVLSLDRGFDFCDNVVRLFQDRERLGWVPAGDRPQAAV